MYLELLTNMSFLGVFAFLFLIVRLISVNRKIQRSLLSLKADLTQDMKFLYSLSRAVVAFIFLRLVLGVFGMDTYEIYWWFAAGLTISLYRCVGVVLVDNKNNVV